MKISLSIIFVITFIIFINTSVQAKRIPANPSNYLSYLNTLISGDTLLLSSGSYTGNLKLIGIQGDSANPIVIMGSGLSTVFFAQACCNTISITQCAYLVIKNFKLDGMHIQVDAVKGEGTTGNWAHHITIEYLNIINYDGDQQNVGISTKCHAWNWIIRKNKLQNIGTGMYLGNSDGDKPFVNGIIEYNLIANTIGYNIEIKHQFNTVRDAFPGTAVNGKTIVRHNVFTKNETSSTGSNARPNLLVGGFPSAGWGASDYYEIYGNFFYNNPVEALFQGTGNISLYENIFVNHFDPSGIRAVYITPQNGINPQDIKVFHNTVWANNSSGGIRLYNPNSNYKQYCYANAVFATSAITNFSDNKDNITDLYSNAGTYILSASMDISTLDMYPKSGQLKSNLTSDTLFHSNTFWEYDFNGDLFDWSYRGAYFGCCINKAWKLQLDTIPSFILITSTSSESLIKNISLYPDPVSSNLFIEQNEFNDSKAILYNESGEFISEYHLNTTLTKIDCTHLAIGYYSLKIENKGKSIVKHFLKF